MKLKRICIVGALLLSTLGCAQSPIAVSSNSPHTAQQTSPRSSDYYGLSATGASPFEQRATDYSMSLDSIRRIYCGGSVGTSEVINGNTFLTASHVVSENGVVQSCIIDGKPASVVYNNPKLDVAIVYSQTDQLDRMPISCEGFIPGNIYLMIGYPKGMDFSIQIVKATTDFIDTYDRRTKVPIIHTRLLNGKPSIPGMSGGAIFNLSGEIVGTILAVMPDGNSLSRELKETYLCAPSDK